MIVMFNGMICTKMSPTSLKFYMVSYFDIFYFIYLFLLFVKLFLQLKEIYIPLSFFNYTRIPIHPTSPVKKKFTQ